MLQGERRHGQEVLRPQFGVIHFPREQQFEPLPTRKGHLRGTALRTLEARSAGRLPIPTVF
jgi:hypothetical protein